MTIPIAAVTRAWPRDDGSPTSPRTRLPRSLPSTRRFGNTRTRLMRGPSSAIIAGNKVIDASTETAGINRPPMPIDLMNGSGSRIMLTSPTATVEPETITERPACCMVVTIASSVGCPCRSSSRNRKIISSA